MTTADPAIIETEAGSVRGSLHAGYRLFQGIPYAAPPSGARRWLAPQPVEPWAGIRDATGPGAICPQQAELFADVSSVDEDCLFLNVTTPQTAHEQPKPVMVWLHGGSGANGAGSLFDPHRLAVTGDVVVVTVNYRRAALQSSLALYDYPSGTLMHVSSHHVVFARRLWLPAWPDGLSLKHIGCPAEELQDRYPLRLATAGDERGDSAAERATAQTGASTRGRAIHRCRHCS